ncbi:zinc-binding dehydrogenase [Streptomyces sp. KL116D]|uniref:zinc-binding dehydrogenase n=1 Tax=Streptomyces sp. KL116D TaxID=3045152 RepID=UPI003558BCA8
MRRPRGQAARRRADHRARPPQARTDIARRFGATDVVAERGDAAVQAIRALTKGQGAHALIEAVGTEQSMKTAVDITRDGGAIGFVGVPHGSWHRPRPGRHVRPEHRAARRRRPDAHLHPELLPDVLDGTIDPLARLRRLTVGIEGVPGGTRRWTSAPP